MPVELVVQGSHLVYVPVPHTRYQEVAADIVRDDVKSLAEMALAAAVEDLGLAEAPTLRWFDTETAESKRMRERYGSVPWGTFEGGEDLRGAVHGKSHTDVWISARLRDDEEVAEAVFHEVKHVQQYSDFIARRAGAFDMPTEDVKAEADASAYAAELLAKCLEVVEELTEPPAPTFERRSSNHSPLRPHRERFEVKGIQHIVCDGCGEGVPLNVMHRCRPAHRRAAAW